MTLDPAHPAPGRLRLVQLFVNTVDRYGGQDELSAPQQAARWLAEHQLIRPGSRITLAGLAELHDLREALRDLASANTRRQSPPAEAIAAFNKVARAHPSTVVLDAEGGRLGASLATRGTDVAGVLSAAVHEAVIDGTWPRLKACSNSDCAWLFFDVSRSRTGRWCSMAACGSINKARTYRRRRALRPRSGDAET
jgi:predicted RNA-binding Zn ribbon-like protein